MQTLSSLFRFIALPTWSESDLAVLRHLSSEVGYTWVERKEASIYVALFQVKFTYISGKEVVL